MGGDGGIILLAVYANAKAENLAGLYETDTLNDKDSMCSSDFTASSNLISDNNHYSTLILYEIWWI